MTYRGPRRSLSRPAVYESSAAGRPNRPNSPAHATPRSNGGPARWKASVAQKALKAAKTVAPRKAENRSPGWARTSRGSDPISSRYGTERPSRDAGSSRGRTNTRPPVSAAATR
ncbi:hypothetical protein WQO_14165 [Streptomyces globisporus C-1027]|uniref:Uncharacterized protein n=1 Tax=Streptomyces globisporus C-1027 TaxID=1172567 RepID=A0A0U3K5W7_STRGL|nr:hypothetical protein WQO_14165 [Streptomyces globisporus C-1027]